MTDNLVSFLFAGDFASCRGFERLALDKGPEIFGDLRENIVSTDLSFLNLEAPLCFKGAPVLKSGPNLRAHPDCIRSVAEAGFNVVSLANNHIMDFGETGLIETIDICKHAELVTCGAGKNLAEAQQVMVIERKELKIAFIAVAEHEFCIAGPDKAGCAPLDIIDNIKQIEKAKTQADFIFISIHGGNEYFQFPRPGLRKLCRFYLTRGADVVICHHAHVPGAYEIYENKPIVYGLGNLIFDHARPPVGWDKGYAVSLVYDAGTKAFSQMDIIPYTQSVGQGGVIKMQGEEKTAFLQETADYNRVLGDNEAYIKAWAGFCKREKNIALLRQYLPFHFRGMRRISRMVNPEPFLIFTKYNKQVKLNTIRCESHLELLQSVLAEEFDP